MTTHRPEHSRPPGPWSPWSRWASSSDLARVPVGTMVVDLTSGVRNVVLDAVDFEVSPDGDAVLILRSRRTLPVRAGSWAKLGRVLRDPDGETWVGWVALAEGAA